jgi:hypothetical protein
MAALALTMKRIFQVQNLSPGAGRVAFFTFLHRQSRAPDIAAMDIVVMAGGAVHPGGLMGLVPEKHRTFSPGLKLAAL